MTAFDHDALERLEIATRAALSPLAAANTDEWSRAVGGAFARLVGAQRWLVAMPHVDVYVTSDGVDRQAVSGIHRYLLAPTIKGVPSEDRALHNFNLKMRAMGVEALNYGVVDALLGGGGSIRRTFFQMEVLEPGALGNFYSLLIEVPHAGGVVPVALSAYPDGPRRDRVDDPNLALMRLVSPALRAGMDVFHRMHAQRLALDGVAEPMAVHDTRGRPVHRNAALSALLAADPEHERVEGELRALAASLGALITRRRGVEPLRVESGERRLRTARGAYTLRASLLPHPVVGADGSVMIYVSLDAGRVTLPPPEAIRERFGLTPREADIGLLVAEGLSNAEIAERCGISTFTARNHVERLLSKLGVDSRKAVALTLIRGCG